jgi:cytochrome c-type biogenesis protein CcmH
MFQKSARAILVLLSLIVASAAAYAVQPNEVLPDPALEARARGLSANLRCLVCQNQSIDDSDAPLARDLRLLVRERLVAGDSDAEVTRFLVARYGEFVLLRPPLGWHTLMLWLTPVLLLMLAAGGIGWRLVKARGQHIAPAQSPLTADEQARLASLMKDTTSRN